MRPGRNEPCQCGSGKKFKHCHGASTQPVKDSSPKILPIEVLQAIAKQESERKAFTSIHGAAKEIISAKLDDWRIVATGNKLHYAKNWKVFVDFL